MAGRVASLSNRLQPDWIVYGPTRKGFFKLANLAPLPAIEDSAAKHGQCSSRNYLPAESRLLPCHSRERSQIQQIHRSSRSPRSVEVRSFGMESTAPTEVVEPTSHGINSWSQRTRS